MDYVDVSIMLKCQTTKYFIPACVYFIYLLYSLNFAYNLLLDI